MRGDHTDIERRGDVCLGTADSDESPTNAAHLDASLDSDVALLPPAGAPGVLHQPVVHTVLSPVTHHRHCVVWLGRAGAPGENSSLGSQNKYEALSLVQLGWGFDLIGCHPCKAIVY